MKTINIRQTRKDFIKSYFACKENPYFSAMEKAFELSAGKNWDKINFTYDSNGLSYLAIENYDGNREILYEGKNKP